MISNTECLHVIWVAEHASLNKEGGIPRVVPSEMLSVVLYHCCTAVPGTAQHSDVGEALGESPNMTL